MKSDAGTAPNAGSAAAPAPGRGPAELPPASWRWLGGIAAGAFVVLMAFAGRYGYHRDELYFLAASRHMAWGYVDQPPLSVALVWISRHLFGDSLYGLRLFPALAYAGAVLLAGLLARELGGRRFAQIFAALCLAVSPFLIAAHLAGPTVYDLVGWGVTMLVVMRILRTGDQRLWLLVGVVVGVSLFAKQTILLLVVALLAGFVVNRQWRVLGSRYLWVGAALALVIWLPNLLWQAGHGWPALAMSGSLQQEHSGLGYALKFVFIQFALPGWWAAPVWLAGLWALWREPRFRAYRAFAAAYGLLFVFLIVVIADRPYYLGPLYLALFGAGAIVTGEVVQGSRRFFSPTQPSRRLLWRSPRAAIAWILVLGVLFLPMALPILPAHWLHTVPLQKINYNLGEEVGWPELVRTVAGVYDSLPASERATTAIVTGNYGEAGAVDRYGPALGLPPAYSGHNNYWWWGPPPAGATTAIVIGLDADGAWLRRYWASVTLAGRVRNAAGVDNDEEGMPVWLCRGLKRPWRVIWPDFRQYG